MMDGAVPFCSVCCGEGGGIGAHRPLASGLAEWEVDDFLGLEVFFLEEVGDVPGADFLAEGE